MLKVVVLKLTLVVLPWQFQLHTYFIYLKLLFHDMNFTIYYLSTIAPVNTSTITECKQYRSLPKGTGTSSTRIWDQVADVSCDNGDNVYGWYRYASKEGGEMAGVCLENQNSTSSRYGQPCGANFRGWMMDRHPTVKDGRVQRRICFSYDKRCYCEFYKNIAVRNCGDYYVYRLTPLKTCKARYCGAPDNQKSKGKRFSRYFHFF